MKFVSPASLADLIASSLSLFVSLLWSSGISLALHSGRYWNITFTLVPFPSFWAIQFRMGFVQHSRCSGRTRMRIMSSPCFLASRWFLVEACQ